RRACQSGGSTPGHRWNVRSLLDRESEGSTRGERAVDARLGLAAPDRTAYTLELARKLELVARLDDALEPDSVDPCKERQLAAILLLGEDGYGAGLSHRLDDENTRHDRAGRKVARQAPPGGDDPRSCGGA